MICACLLISTINLIVARKGSNELVSDSKIIRASYDRINHSAVNRMQIRILLNIANGYEPDST